jgi:membrane associated rhomboid family serine protease
MVQVVVLQAIFDAMVPEVSSTAHLGGAVCGFVVGLAVRAINKAEVKKPTVAER